MTVELLNEQDDGCKFSASVIFGRFLPVVFQLKAVEKAGIIMLFFVVFFWFILHLAGGAAPHEIKPQISQDEL